MIARIEGMAAAAPETPADQRRLQAAVRAWNGRTFTARDVLPVLARALELAQVNYSRTKWGNEQFPEGTGLYSEAPAHLKQLEYLYGLMTRQKADPYVFTAAHKTWGDIKRATLDPIMWQSNAAAVSRALDAAEVQLYEDLVSGILNLPGELVAAAVTIVANALEKGLGPLLPKTGIPGWVAPVVIGGAALGLGVWVYSTLRKVTP